MSTENDPEVTQKREGWSPSWRYVCTAVVWAAIGAATYWAGMRYEQHLAIQKQIAQLEAEKEQLQKEEKLQRMIEKRVCAALDEFQTRYALEENSESKWRRIERRNRGICP